MDKIGKFFKVAGITSDQTEYENPINQRAADEGRKGKDRLMLDDPEVRRAISERALIKTIDPGFKTDSIGFIKGKTAKKFLERNIKPIDWQGKTFLKNIDPMKVRRIARVYGNQKLDPNFDKSKKVDFTDTDRLMEYAGASEFERDLAHGKGALGIAAGIAGAPKPKEVLYDFRKNLAEGLKHHKYNLQKDIAYEKPTKKPSKGKFGFPTHFWGSTSTEDKSSG